MRGDHRHHRREVGSLDVQYVHGAVRVTAEHEILLGIREFAVARELGLAVEARPCPAEDLAGRRRHGRRRGHRHDRLGDRLLVATGEVQGVRPRQAPRDTAVDRASRRYERGCVSLHDRSSFHAAIQGDDDAAVESLPREVVEHRRTVFAQVERDGVRALVCP